MTKYEDVDWKKLPKDVQKAAEFLGYNKKMWDHDQAPALEDNDWKELSSEQQAAATVLGYDEETWDAESDSDSDDE